VKISLITAWTAGVMTIALSACSNNSRPAESAMVETPASESSSAVDSISEARCARESRCDNIGNEKKYSSMEDCVARVREDWKDDLDARSCSNGVNQTQLNECLSQVRGEECSSPFDTLERVAACTTGQICAK
jgi:hypothetical protein